MKHKLINKEQSLPKSAKLITDEKGEVSNVQLSIDDYKKLISFRNDNIAQIERLNKANEEIKQIEDGTLPKVTLMYFQSRI
ncbi:MAG: hypothetical protein Kapaf2KO_20130 [Candidatus Kapaibacteriales bacterium]